MATLSLGSPSTMAFQPKPSAGIEAERGNEKCVLEFMVQHGDMVVMHGSEIHRQYLVCVLLSGKQSGVC